MSVRQAVQEYLLDCQARNLSARTVRWYEQKLGLFVEFLERLNVTDITEAANPSIIRQFLNDLSAIDSPQRDGEKLSGHTIAGYDQVLRSFFGFLHSEEVLPANPMKRIRKIRRPRTIIPTFSRNEIHRMLNVYAARRDYKEHRNYCILLLLYDSGIRLEELVKLRVENIYLDSWSFLVHGKWDKERLVPMGRTLRTELANYLRERDRYLHMKGLRDRGYLFFRERDGAPLSASYAYRVVRRAGELADVHGKRVSPHTWRHTSAVDYIRAGGDVFSLREKLGHRDIATTQIYVRLAEGDINMLHRRHSPLDSLDSRR